MKTTHQIVMGLLLGSLGLNLGIIPSAQAGDSGDSRLQHRFGFYAGVLNDPYPTLVGINLAVNVFSFLRLNAGYGSISGTGISMTSLGGGAKFMIPGTSFTPVLGINYANVNVSITSAAAQALNGFSANGGHTYLNAGFDWQAHVGFNLGVGYNYSLLSTVGGAPYFNIGWFF